jgi:hypothetical protein
MSIRFVDCAFINSNQPPAIEERQKGYHVELEEGLDGRKLVIYGFFLRKYPHPEAPEHATIQVLVQRIIEQVKESDPNWSAAYLLYNAEENLRRIVS